MPAELTYQPVRDGYTFIPTYPIQEALFEGAATRKRLDPLYKTHTITLNWRLNPVTYTNFMGFFRTTLKDTTEFFLMDLVTSVGTLVPHRCRTVGGLPKLNQINGTSFYVSATLEVEVNPSWTGLILYEEPNIISFTHTSPRLVGPLQPGNIIQIFDTEGIHPTGSTPLNLDGEYEIDVVTPNNEIELVSPSSVNSDWTVLAGLGAPGQYGTELLGNVISTIMRIPQ